MSLPLEPVLAKLDANRAAAIERWQELLRIPSVGTDPRHHADTRRAAEWVAGQLRQIGFEACCARPRASPWWSVIPAADGQGGPHVLFYGHYDVQPVEPIGLWDSRPSSRRSSTQPDGRKWIARAARGRQGPGDDLVEAVRAWQEVHGEAAGARHRAP